ncbi:conserved domain protein [Prevotella denticola CRIS 18C-A]|uniref:Conserved domain protein n=1 Tax=Prevotella denticola CRIS 18C-A TaxID=944557 RepID=F0HAM5_9BACT|nr:conserved domain protein [Prevotella denticola CRIS 18C-A]
MFLCCKVTVNKVNGKGIIDKSLLRHKASACFYCSSGSFPATKTSKTRCTGNSIPSVWELHSRCLGMLFPTDWE